MVAFFRAAVRYASRFWRFVGVGEGFWESVWEGGGDVMV